MRGASRREFIGWSSVAGGAALFSALGPAASDPELLEALAQRIDPDFATNFGGFTATVRRPDDQLLLNIQAYNTSINFTNNPPTLGKVTNELPTYLSVDFGTIDNPAPMHVAEQAFTLSDADNLPPQPGAPANPPSATAVDPPPVAAHMGGGTRLMFQIPDALLEPNPNPLTLTTDDLLNFVNFRLVVVPNAVPPFDTLLQAPAGIGAPRAPDPISETRIELPTNVIISPPATYLSGEAVDPRRRTVFVNKTDPVTHSNGWTELWHTRLAITVVVGGIDQLQHVEVDETNRELRTVRAIWCTDQGFQTDLTNNVTNPPNDGEPLPNSVIAALRYVDRYDIVRLSSDFTPTNGPYGRVADTNDSKNKRKPTTPFIPSPATVDRLMLSSLGGWLDSDAHWDLPHLTGKYNSSLLQWRQRTAQSRDSYVRIVRKGFLFPWGHRASLVTVTERKFAEKSGSVGAYLRQRTFIVVGQPSKNYTRNASIRDAGRNLPFTDVEVLTLVTPDLDQPTRYTTKALQGDAQTLFEPMLGGVPFRFHMRGTDWAGAPIDFHSPVVWVDDTVAYDDTATVIQMTNKLFNNWNADPAELDLRGQRVSMAPPKDPTLPGDTQLVLTSMKLSADRPVNGPDGTSQFLINTSQPCFFPGLDSATVQHPEATTLSGNNVSGSTMKYYGDYLSFGFGDPGGVFLQTKGTAHKITFNSDKGGGSLTPNLSINGFSRDSGPVSGDIAQYAGGTFDPATIFQGVDAKLLGGIPLTAILRTISFADAGDARLLNLTSVEKQQPSHQIITTLDWKPWITEGGPKVLGSTVRVFVPLDTEDDNGVQVAKNSADLHAVIVTDLDHPANSSSNIVGELRDFELHLFGDGATEFVVIPFDRLHFHARSGKKTDVQVDISDSGVQFVGALEFVQDLADALSFAGSGLTVDTSGDAITANLTLAIPSLSVGVFGLENLAFIAGVAIPYNGDPVRFDFSFCTRENPFQLEIMIFTGGGFVGLGVGADGVELLEFSFDFGLGFDLDIGIASGQISLTGGVYFELEKENNGNQNIDLTAWVKASGGISALGLISISVELYLALEYQSDGVSSQLAGDAEMSISVHIIFFGFTVGFSVHEEFAGSSAPSFAAHLQPALGGVSPAALTDPATNLITSMSQQEWARYCTSFALIGVGA